MFEIKFTKVERKQIIAELELQLTYEPMVETRNRKRLRPNKVAEIDDFNREIELTRQNKPLLKLLESRARQKATISLQEAKERLGIEK